MKNKKLLTIGLLLFGLGTAKAQYTDLHDFSGPDGNDPYGSLTLSGNVLYGVTVEGGANWLNNDGNIFSVKTDGTSFKDLYDFNFTNGRNPYCTLALSKGALYGMTWMGEGYDFGNIFSIDTNGSGYSSLYNFNNTQGGHPRASVTLAGSILYGTTEAGGTYNAGAIFSIDSNGTGYKDLFNFNDTDGSTPKGSLTLVGNVLYGMTSVGGGFGYGNVFSIHTDGTGFKVLLNFNGTNGGDAQRSLTYLNGKLFGMSAWGGAYSKGVIFSIDTNGTGYADLHNFNGTGGASPNGSLTLSGNMFYGMTAAGGAYGDGILFSIDTNGTAYTDLLDFDYTNGAVPYGSLTVSGNMLYGMTSEGGAYGCGVVFSYQINYYVVPPLTVSINSVVNAACNGGNTGIAIANAATGGVSPYTYKWSPSAGSGLVASNLSAGIYTITVTDNIGNTATATATITQPTPVAIAIASVKVESCQGIGNITSSPATGGTPPYTYKWLPAEGTNLTVNNLNEGIYTIVATDNNGCSASASATIKLPPTLAVTTDLVSGITCNNGLSGAILAKPTGGNAPYYYSWAPGGETDATASNLSAGTYTVTVTDSNGCNIVTSTTITQPTAMSFTTYITATSECNGAATITVSGGVQPYTYYWVEGGSTSNSIENRCAGNYSCIVTDSLGCSQTVGVVITTITGIADNANSSTTINVYPNPTANQFSVSGTMPGMVIEMYDDMGRAISNVVADNETMKFSLTNQPAGMYLIRILSANGTLLGQKKLVKVN